MAGDERFDDSIGRWLEETAPTRLPQRVLDAAFERTRRSRQQTDWRTVLGRPSRTRLVPALGGAAVATVAALLVLNIGLINEPGGTPTPPPAATSSPSVAASSPPGFLWPQTTLEEVRAAQELADAGDSRYVWQVDPSGYYQPGQNHPLRSNLLHRFLKEVLGWDTYRWDEAAAHREGLVSGDVIFLRCAPGQANLLYPSTPGRPGCGPTIDELRYETVKITVAQLIRPDDPGGLWVVTGWEMIEPFAQADPLVLEAAATPLMAAFLQARIAGEGAEALADFPVDPDIPLLYATSNGARYERTESELVEGPRWPDGRMEYTVRLFADNGATTVEQHFSVDRGEDDRLQLLYEGEYGGRPATTENGKAVPVAYDFLDGVVTFRAAWPLGPGEAGPGDSGDRLFIEGLLPDDGAPRQILALLADPRPIGQGCAGAPDPVDVAALARSIAADPNFDGPTPVAVTIGGLPALQLDGVGAQATSCGILLQSVPSAGRGQARLYLVDLPGERAQVLAIAISADDDSFATVLGWAMPIVDSIEFHAR